MKTKINNGGPAFPETIWGSGMTLGDYFAGQALKGMLANPNLKVDISDDILSDEAYNKAEAMLKRRLKK